MSVYIYNTETFEYTSTQPDDMGGMVTNCTDQAPDFEKINDTKNYKVTYSPSEQRWLHTPIVVESVLNTITIDENYKSEAEREAERKAENDRKHQEYLQNLVLELLPHLQKLLNPQGVKQ